MAKKTVGSLNVLLSLSTRAFTGGIAKATETITKFAAKTAAVGAGVAGSLGVAATTVAFLTKQAADAADELVKMSDLIGIASERMAGFKLAADLAGASVEGLETGMIKFLKTLSEAKSGTKSAKEAFAFLGLDPNKLAGQKPDEAFLAVLDALNKIGNQADRTRAAMDLFGKSSRDVLKIVNSQSKSVREAIDATKRFGTALNRIEANKIEQMNDALRTARELFNGIWTQLAKRVSPMVTGATNAMIAWADKTHLVSRAVTAIQDAVQTTAIFIAQKLQDIRHNFIETVAIAMRAWANVLDFFEDLTIGIVATADKAGTAIVDSLFPSAAISRGVESMDAFMERLDLEQMQAAGISTGKAISNPRSPFAKSLETDKRIKQLRKDAKALDDLVKVERKDLLGDRLFRWFEGVQNAAEMAGRSISDFLRQRTALTDHEDMSEKKKKSFEIGFMRLDPVNRGLPVTTIFGTQRGETVETEQLGVLKQILGATSRTAENVRGLVLP